MMGRLGGVFGVLSSFSRARAGQQPPQQWAPSATGPPVVPPQYAPQPAPPQAVPAQYACHQHGPRHTLQAPPQVRARAAAVRAAASGRTADAPPQQYAPPPQAAPQDAPAAVCRPAPQQYAPPPQAATAVRPPAPQAPHGRSPPRQGAPASYATAWPSPAVRTDASGRAPVRARSTGSARSQQYAPAASIRPGGRGARRGRRRARRGSRNPARRSRSGAVACPRGASSGPRTAPAQLPARRPAKTLVPPGGHPRPSVTSAPAGPSPSAEGTGKTVRGLVACAGPGARGLPPRLAPAPPPTERRLHRERRAPALRRRVLPAGRPPRARVRLRGAQERARHPLQASRSSPSPRASRSGIVRDDHARRIREHPSCFAQGVVSYNQCVESSSKTKTLRRSADRRRVGRRRSAPHLGRAHPGHGDLARGDREARRPVQPESLEDGSAALRRATGAGHADVRQGRRRNRRALHLLGRRSDQRAPPRAVSDVPLRLPRTSQAPSAVAARPSASTCGDRSCSASVGDALEQHLRAVVDEVDEHSREDAPALQRHPPEQQTHHRRRDARGTG